MTIGFIITKKYDIFSYLTFQMKHAKSRQIIIQIDNCAREGKNWKVFVFAAHLVYWE